MNTDGMRASAWRFDRFTLDNNRGALLTASGAEVPLRPKSMALLRLLVENAGRLLERAPNASPHGDTHYAAAALTLTF